MPLSPGTGLVKELLLGIGLGLGAGVSPGPLLALVLTNTLKRGFGAGVRVALAPVLTDAPIVLITVVAVNGLPGAAVRALGGAGGVYLLWIGGRTFVHARAATVTEAEGAGTKGDLWQGVAANVLSPHPWLFWLSVGAPILSTAWERAPTRGVAFLVGFYGLLLGSKVALAAMVAAVRRRMVERWYRLGLAAAGALLAVAGAVLLWDAAGGQSGAGPSAGVVSRSRASTGPSSPVSWPSSTHHAHSTAMVGSPPDGERRAGQPWVAYVVGRSGSPS